MKQALYYFICVSRCLSSSQATITKYHRFDGLNSINLFLHDSGGGEVPDQDTSMVRFW